MKNPRIYLGILAAALLFSALLAMTLSIQAAEFTKEDVERFTAEFMSVVKEGDKWFHSSKLGKNAVSCDQVPPQWGQYPPGNLSQVPEAVGKGHHPGRDGELVPPEPPGGGPLGPGRSQNSGPAGLHALGAPRGAARAGQALIPFPLDPSPDRQRASDRPPVVLSPPLTSSKITSLFASIGLIFSHERPR